jgi:eukaryotic-like serine/threonine-protein kinase
VRQNLQEAIDRGDRYAAANLRTGLANLTWLIAHDPDGAQMQIDETMAGWSQRGFHIQHYYDVIARAGIDLYRGHGTTAHGRVLERWNDFAKSLLLMVQFVRIDSLCIRARTALAASLETRTFAPLLGEADRCAAKIEREKMAWSTPLAALLEAGIAQRRGTLDVARKAYEKAMFGFDAASMRLYAAVARMRFGELIGGDEGRAHVEAARIWMTSQSIVRPERIAAMLAPVEVRA